MNFCWVTLPVKNFAESLDFYHNLLGLKIASEVENDEIKMVMLGDDKQTKIELIHYKNELVSNYVSNISIGLRVDSLENTIEYLNNNNIKIIRGPISPNPNLSFIFINDPDGYEVQFVEMK